MAKSKTKESKKAPAASAVKNAGVVKASKSDKAKSKDVAKAAAKKVVKEKDVPKKKKKVVEPEPSSESESESEAASSSDSDSSESEAETKTAKKPAADGKAKAAKKVESKSKSESESGSDSDSESESETETKKSVPNGKAKAVAKKAESESESDSDSESEEETAKPKANGKVKAAAKAESAESSDSSDSDAEKDSKSDASEEDSDDSEDDSEESDEAKTKTDDASASKKRKADDEIDATAKKAKTDEQAATTLFIGNMSWSIDDNALYEAFKDFEGLLKARVVTERATGRSRGFGYVDFDDGANATKAYEAMQGFELDNRTLNVDYSNPRPAEGNSQDRAADRAKRHGDTVSPPSDTLFVGNLPFDVDQDSVSQFFSEVAEVASVRLPTDPDSGNLKGFGYVGFNSIQDAKSALEQLNGSSIGSGRSARNIRLDFASARPPREGGGFGGRDGGRGGRGGGRGRGGDRGRGGRGGGRGRGRGDFGTGANRTPSSFAGTKMTFD